MGVRVAPTAAAAITSDAADTTGNVGARTSTSNESGNALPTRSLETNAATSVLLTHNQNKMCLDPSSLVRSMSLLDSKLQEQVGSMDIVNPLRAIYTEHCHAPDSDNVYTPSSYPGLSCTPKGEFLFVVGEDGIDQDDWKLKCGAGPTCGSGSMVQGRNNKSLDELLTAPEAQAANLVPEEVLALRLCSGPLRHIYDAILGQLSTSELVTRRNTYPTTIALVVSGIKKLSAVAKAPAGGAVWRSLASGVRLPDTFFERDEQGFAWGMDTGFMATSRHKSVALKCSSGEGEGEGRTVFRIVLGKMSMGANIAWYVSPPPQFTRFRFVVLFCSA
jgi:hypothetical protein